MGSALRSRAAAAPGLATLTGRARLARPQVTYHVLLGSVAGLLVLLVGLELLVSAAMLTSPRELMYGESILYSHAHRLVSGQALYQPLDRLPYTAASYTPVFYVVAAVGQSLSGPGFGSGRAVALVAVLGAAALVGVLGASNRSGARAGLLAASLFLALGVPGSGPVPWMALYKEDSLALALALATVALVWHGRDVPRAAWLAGVLAALAVLTKQTVLPLVLASGVWLWWRDRAQAVRFAASGLGLAGVVIAGLEWASGGAFVANTVGANVNPLATDWLASNLQLLVLFQVGPLVAAAIGLVSATWRRTSLSGLLALSWLGASLLLAGLAKLGGASNHWMPMAALTAVLAARGLAAQDALPTRPTLARWVALGSLVAGLVLVGPVAARTWLGELATLGAAAADDRAFGDLVGRVRATPGEVLADPLDVVALAGREPLFEPLLLDISEQQSGQWDARRLTEQVCTGRVRLVVLGQPIEATHWPAALQTAVARTMVLEGVTAGRLVYVPAQATTGSCASA